MTAPTTGATASFSTGPNVTTDNAGLAQVSVVAGSVSGTYNVGANLTSGLTLGPAIFNLANHTRIEAWRAANLAGEWRNTGNAANNAAPFHDGVVNLLKFAFNLNAQAPDSTTMTATGSKGLPLLGRDPTGRLTLTFVRRKAATTPGIAYVVEFSDSLADSFAPNPLATTAPVVSIDGTWERVVVVDSAPSSQRFAQLVVTAP